MNENIIIAGDSVYYANNSKDYKLYTVMSVDKENILLNASGTGYKNELVPAKNEFFVKNISINNFKRGKVVSFEEANENGPSFDLEGIVFGVSENKVLVKTNKGFYVFPLSRLSTKSK